MTWNRRLDYLIFYYTGGLDPFFDMTMDFLYSCS